MEVTGRDQQDGEALAERLGVRSTRVIHLILKKCRNKLQEEEVLMLKEYGEGVEEPDTEDTFSDSKPGRILRATGEQVYKDRARSSHSKWKSSV